MTFEEALAEFIAADGRSTVRDRAIIRAVSHEMGGVSLGVLMAVSLPQVEDVHAMDTMRERFVEIWQRATEPVEVPRGVITIHPGKGQHVHVGLDKRLHAEIGDDGHTYIDGERID